jgi:hypothetical protein
VDDNKIARAMIFGIMAMCMVVLVEPRWEFLTYLGETAQLAVVMALVVFFAVAWLLIENFLDKKIPPTSSN